MSSINYFFITSLLIYFAGYIDQNEADGSKINELSERLGNLRELMKESNITGYIIPNEDDHHSEAPATVDRRREYISGFTGTAGHGIVTDKQAALITDSRYYIQAKKQLPPSWELIEGNHTLFLTIKDWIVNNIPPGRNVGIDPKKINGVKWKELNEQLKKFNITLKNIENNLIDEIWGDRPESSKDPLYIHHIKYAGEPYNQKLKRLREEMNSSNWNLLVVTTLDEIAWLYNLRGNYMQYSPMFKSYSIISNDYANLYVDDDKITPNIISYLSKTGAEVQIKPYEHFWQDLQLLSKTVKTVFIPKKSSYAVFMKVPEKSVKTGPSPLIDMKAVKNDVEVQGSRNAHIRDSVALCELFKLMEEEVPQNISWDEINVADMLDKFRQEVGKELYKGPSFATHAAFGPHAAMPHYKSKPDTNIFIDTTAPMTLDSGGQYLDGTIDTTRVLHFGEPTDFQKDVYTALLEGCIDLADTVFPNGSTYNGLEILIRRPLLKLGLTFGHGTTHGTGIFSNVHEAFNESYFKNFIGSQEPGYYVENEFGMRLENLVVVVEADVQNPKNQETLLTFSPLTLVPYEKKLIKPSRLDFRQLAWLNNYHESVKKNVGKEMLKLGKEDLYNWLVNKTAAIEKN